MKSHCGGVARSVPTSASLSRRFWRINNPKKQILSFTVQQGTRCEASGRGFDGHGERTAEEAYCSAADAVMR